MKQRNQKLVRLLCILLSGAMVLGSTACGGGGEVTTEESQAGTAAVESTKPETVVEIQEPEAPEKEKITDFYEYANREWLEGVTVSDEMPVYTYLDSTQEIVTERVMAFLQDTDLESLDAGTTLYKAVALYREVLDQEHCNSLGTASLKEFTDRIDKVKNLNQLYEIYKDERYSVFNMLLHGSVERADYGGYELDADIETLFLPADVVGRDNMERWLTELCMAVGYPESRSKEIAVHTFEMQEQIRQYQDSVSGLSTIWYIQQKQLDEAGVKIPLIEIFDSLGMISDEKGFYAYLDYVPFMAELYTEKNLPMLKDYLMMGSIYWLGRFSEENVRHCLSVVSFGTEAIPDQAMIDENLARTLVEQMLYDDYHEKYISDAQVAETEEMLKEITPAVREVIGSCQWLTTHGKELAKRKVNHINVYIGREDLHCDFQDVEITGDPVEDTLAFLVSRRQVPRQLLVDKRKPQLRGNDMLAVNAWYIREYNAILITDGWLSDPMCSADRSYEERLAYLGNTIAHEICHAYDPYGSFYDEEGIREDWMKEEEYVKYQESVDRITAFFDGKTTEYGNAVDGNLVKGESFADLMAMEVCLKVLDKRENPDYDAFFRAYAKHHAAKCTKEGEERRMDGNTHLPDKFRVNYILGQFDRFYEVYDVDENSPWYVPAEERLTTF